MRYQIYVALCMLGMFGFFQLCRYLIYSTSEGFSAGVATGVALTIVLVFIAEKVDAKR